MNPRPAIALAAVLLLWAQPALSLQVEGPAPDRVYQRGADNTADIDVAISDAAAPASEIVVTLEGNGFSLNERSAIEGGAASLTLPGVPVGGPYRIDIESVSGDGASLHERTIGDILVGDIWILAGQSNMEGSARLRNLEEPSPMVRSYSFGDEWEVARDPLSRWWESVDPVHWRTPVARAPIDSRVRALVLEAGMALDVLSPRKQPIAEEVRELLAANGLDIADHIETMRPDVAFRREVAHQRTVGAGLGVAFGKELYNVTGVPVGFIFAANGGTSMLQWSPDLEHHGGESLYGSMVRRIRQQGGRIAGVAWYQGEYETIEPEDVDAFKERFRYLIESIRNEVNDPELPFVYVQLGKCFHSTAYKAPLWDGIRHHQLDFEDVLPALAMVPAIEGDLDDTVHVNAVHLRALGRQMARQAGRVMGLLDIEGGPRLDTVEVASGDRMQLRLNLRGVNGSLSINSVYPQFRILDGSNRLQQVTRVEVDPDDPAALLLTLLHPAPSEITIEYGRGMNPLTGVVDGEGLALPAFPPVRAELGSAFAD